MISVLLTGLTVMGAPQLVTIEFVVRGPIERSDLPGLYARICRLLLGRRARRALCDVSEIAADAVAADALARLALAARRLGCEISLRGSSRQLRELLAFMGLAEALPEAAAPRDY
jgi:ABC-type transporter Mla MlaB component